MDCVCVFIFEDIIVISDVTRHCKIPLLRSAFRYETVISNYWSFQFEGGLTIIWWGWWWWWSMVSYNNYWSNGNWPMKMVGFRLYTSFASVFRNLGLLRNGKIRGWLVMWWIPKRGRGLVWIFDITTRRWTGEEATWE